MAEKVEIKASFTGADGIVRSAKQISEELKRITAEMKMHELGYKNGTLASKDFISATQKLAKEVNSLNAPLDKTVNLYRSIWQMQNRAENGFKSLSNSINRQQQSFVALAYIIQDLPYGIRGIANNLTQLSQIIGTPVWLNLGISAFTSLAVVLDSSKTKVKALSDEMKSLDGDMSNTLFKLGRISRKTREYDLEMGVAGAEADVERLNRNEYDSHATIQARLKNPGAIAVYRRIGSEADIKRATQALENARLALKEFNDEQDKMDKKAKDKENDFIERGGANFDDTEVGSTIWKRRFDRDLKRQMDRNARKEWRKGSGADDDNSTALKEQAQQYDNLFFNPMKDGFNDLNSVIRNELFGTLDEMKKRFGTVGASIIQALNAVIAKLIEVAIASAIVTFATGGTVNFGTAFKAISSGTGSAGSLIFGGGDVTSNNKMADQMIMGSSGSRGMKIEVVGKLGNDAIYLAGNRFLSMENAARL